MRVLSERQSQKPTHWFVLLLILFGVLFFFPGLGASHLFDWDEINFAEAAREMLVTRNFLRVQIDFQPFWEKPPLFFWLQAIGFHLFGVNEFAARLPNAFAGIATLLSVFWVGRRLQSPVFGWLWALSYLGSLLPHFYFRTGLIDPIFNLFIFWGIASVAFFYLEKRWPWILLSGLTCGLAVLTKGPVALLLTGLTWGVLYLSFIRSLRFPWRESLAFLVVFALAGSSWFLIEFAKNGPGFFREFITYQARLLSIHDAGHRGFPGYHFVVLLLGCFPSSIFCLQQLFSKKPLPAAQSFFQSWMKILLGVVLVVFSIVKTKILHYSSLAYFPITYFAALAIYDRIFGEDAREHRVGVDLISILVLGTLISLVLIFVPLLMSHPEPILNFIHDPFAKATLDDHSQWTGFEAWIGLFYLGAIVVSSYWLIRRHWEFAFYTLCFGTALTVMSVTIWILPKIEQATQGGAISYYQEYRDQNVYIQPYRFKSFAHLFYSKKIPHAALGLDSVQPPVDWLLSGKADRPVYFVARVTSQIGLIQNKYFVKKGERNGFALYGSVPGQGSSNK